MLLVVLLGFDAEVEKRVVVLISFVYGVFSMVLVRVVREVRWIREDRKEANREDRSYSGSKAIFSSWINGEIETHPASPASITCSIVKMVVARVLIPSDFSCRHALRPSYVPGTFMTMREVSNSGSTWRKIW